MKFKLQKLDHANGVLRNQLEIEHKKIKELRSDKSNYLSGRNELEEFFLECVEEVKKEIQKRKEHQTKSSRYSVVPTTAKSLSSTKTSKPKLGVFQNQDKFRVIELLMENDNVLLFLYEQLFPVTSLQTNQIQIQTNKNNQAEMMKAGSRLSLLS